ncbi:MAG: hypothetical protein ACT6QS_05765 [Flavobacteriales bacterium]
MSAPGPVINCHTHIFIGDNVPPYIAKTFLPDPLYRIFSVKFILQICRFWFIHPKSPRQWKYLSVYKNTELFIYNYRMFVRRRPVLKFLVRAFNVLVTYHALLYFFYWISTFFIKTDRDTTSLLSGAAGWLNERKLFYFPEQWWLRLAVVAFTLVFIATGRKIIFYLWKRLWKFLSMLPDKQTLRFMARYLHIGRFAYYRNQGRIFIKLKNQYEPGTGFVILPMDMHFMGASPKNAPDTYGSQMAELYKLKQNRKYGEQVFPFVFADPRRTQVDGKAFLTWTAANGTVSLGDCFIKEYIEEKEFNGFKIYPALGYYPFDEKLLPLWKYAADNDLPILTHCIRGTIFYRGSKKKDWDRHPVFRERNERGEWEGLLLPEMKNKNFINNFTHPLNYLCLLEERLLRIVVGDASPEVQQLFGYRGPDQEMEHNLAHLKLCFGHYGGDDEWEKFFEKDRDGYTSQMFTQPETGLNFTKPGDIKLSHNTLVQMWHSVDWYSLTSSMMLQYDRVYADISYIIHNEDTYPLLKKSLQNIKLRKRILFGTDFYVVRNHKSEKQIVATIQAALSPVEFNAIARDNPMAFLFR